MASLHGSIDGHLFVIKNLLQLREHISIYDTKFLRSSRSVKISDIFQAILGVISNPLTLQSYGNLASPFVAIQHDDVRQILDSKLKEACQAYILHTCKMTAEPLIAFMKKANTLKAQSGKDALFIQPFAQKEALILNYQNFLELIESNLKVSVGKLRQYLGDKGTQLTLIRIMRVSDSSLK
jgi:hypothetical protein